MTRHIIVTLTVGLGLPFAACLVRGGTDPAIAHPAGISVQTAPVIEQPFAAPILVTGILRSEQETPLAFKVGGVVLQISIDEGDAVRAGQVLAVLDPAEIDASVAKAQAGLVKADQDLARSEALFRDSVISRERLENTRTAKAVADADWAAARFNRRHATIVAPVAGTVLRRLAEPSQTVSPGAAIILFGVAGRGAIVTAGLADRDAARVEVGDHAEVSFDVAPGARFAGRVARIAAAATAATGTYEVEIRLTGRGLGRPGSVSNGLVAEARIEPSRTQPSWLVPIEALLDADGDSGSVYTVDPNGRASRQVVKVLGFTGANAVIPAGLVGGRTVVTTGAAFLRPGDLVRIDTVGQVPR